MILAWILGHEGYQGNEYANKLDCEGSSTTFMEPEFYSGIAKYTIKIISKLLDNLSRIETNKTVYSGIIAKTHNTAVKFRQKNGQNNNRAV